MPHPGTRPCAHSSLAQRLWLLLLTTSPEGCTHPASDPLLHPLLGPDPQPCSGSPAGRQRACEGCATAGSRPPPGGTARAAQPAPARGHSGSRDTRRDPVPSPVPGPQQSRMQGCGTRGRGGGFGAEGFPTSAHPEPGTPQKRGSGQPGPRGPEADLAAREAGFTPAPKRQPQGAGLNPPKGLAQQRVGEPLLLHPKPFLWPPGHRWPGYSMGKYRPRLGLPEEAEQAPQLKSSAKAEEKQALLRSSWLLGTGRNTQDTHRQRRNTVAEPLQKETSGRGGGSPSPSLQQLRGTVPGEARGKPRCIAQKPHRLATLPFSPPPTRGPAGNTQGLPSRTCKPQETFLLVFSCSRSYGRKGYKEIQSSTSQHQC